MFGVYVIIALLIVMIIYLIISLNTSENDDFVEGAIITESR